MHASRGTWMDASCDVWWIGNTEIGNGYEFFPSAKGR